MLFSLFLGSRAYAAPVVTWPETELGLVIDPGQDAAEKNVRAFGYLVSSSSGPRLELAHDRLEASVVYLTGDVAARDLGPRASAGTLVRWRSWTTVVTAPAGSMLPVCGPGWLEGSPRDAIVAGDVLVAVRGRAVYRGRGKLPHDPSRTGVSWTLAVDSVERVLDRGWWDPLEKAHLAHLDAARIALVAGRFAVAATELETSASALTAAFGVDAPRCNWIDATRGLSKRIRALDADPRSLDCRVDGYRADRPSTARPVPHPADLALYAAHKKAMEDRWYANISLGPAHRHDRAWPEADRPAMCWWESTAEDADFPTARHREVAATYLYFAPTLRSR